jgi:2-polyprenyl-6-hydroxyphenyl methylase/3-demethylubiquinone-9 3-methyltransferase
MMTATETAQDERFRFGENWQSFLQTVDDKEIRLAEASMRRLLQRETLGGLRFLDIGCGSGLFSLSARNLGATVHSFDFDAQAVECARTLKAKYWQADPQWTIERGSILDDAQVKRLGAFDVVYAWGVLHHTGEMRRAIANAAALIAPDGVLAIALYRKTTLCPFWTAEKRWYAKASPSAQRVARSIYVTAMRAAFLVRSRDFRQYVDNYESVRGMDYYHDVHDWMGGYPYESISPVELLALAAELSLTCIRSNCHPPCVGLFGSGCDEYVLQKIRKA